MVEGGLRADVIAYTTTQSLGVVVQPHASLCAFVPANSGSLPLGCYQGSAISGSLPLVDVIAASACARVRRGRGPSHVRAFSSLRIDNYLAIVTRELAAAPSCQ